MGTRSKYNLNDRCTIRATPSYPTVEDAANVLSLPNGTVWGGANRGRRRAAEAVLRRARRRSRCPIYRPLKKFS